MSFTQKAIDYAHRLGKYLVAGLVGFGCELTLFGYLTKQLDIHHIIALVISFYLGVTIHYNLSCRFVFNDRTKNMCEHRSRANFLAVSGVSLLASAGLMIIFVDWIQLDPVTSRVLTAAIVGILAFRWHRKRTFNDKKGENSQ